MPPHPPPLGQYHCCCRGMLSRPCHRRKTSPFRAVPKLQPLIFLDATLAPAAWDHHQKHASEGESPSVRSSTSTERTEQVTLRATRAPLVTATTQHSDCTRGLPKLTEQHPQHMGWPHTHVLVVTGGQSFPLSATLPSECGIRTDVPVFSEK